MGPHVRLEDAAPFADDRKPWEQQPDETGKAYQAFLFYLNAGASRTQADAANEIRKIHGRRCGANNIKIWSAKYRWRQRIEWYNSHQVAIETEAKMEVARRRAAEAYEQQWIEGSENLEVAREMRAKAKDMLSRVNFDGEEALNARGKRFLKNKTKWNLGTIARFADVSISISSKSIELMLMHIAIQDGFDPFTADPDKLEAWLAQKGITKVEAAEAE